MLSKSTIPGIGLVFMMIVLLVFAGCSDDKSTSVPLDDLTNGDLEDPDFQLVKERIDNFFTNIQEDFQLGFDNIYQLPTDTDEVRNMYSPMGPDDIVTYAYTNGWHVTNVARFNASFDDYFRDSVQFQISGTPVEDPSGLDQMQYIRHWGYINNEADVTHTNTSGHINFVFDSLDTDVCNINGNDNRLIEYNYFGQDSTIHATYNFDATLLNVHVNSVPGYGWSGSCPTDGEVAIDIDQVYNVDNGSSNQFTIRNWSVSVAIQNGLAAVRVVSNNYVWNYEYQICNPSGS